jgi:hypothetical protein
MAQHKWHKEIKAWADGGDVQFNVGGDWHDWRYNFEPHWDVKEYKFRIKPQPKEPQYLYVYDTLEGIKLGTPGSVVPVKNLNGQFKLLGAIKLEDNDNGND